MQFKRRAILQSEESIVEEKGKIDQSNVENERLA